jgi:hypothetical protein
MILLGSFNILLELEWKKIVAKNGCQKVRLTKGRDLTNIYLF